jgi:ABC-type transport system involved in multi-copper enzyme maturation permease subunit
MLLQDVPRNQKTLVRPALSLYQKELIEFRLHILWAVVITIVLLLGSVALGGISSSDISLQGERPAPVLDLSTVEPPLLSAMFLTALLCGSTIVSPELGKGTLQFLASLPLSRHRIWIKKITSAFAVFVFSTLCILAVWYGMLVMETLALHRPSDIAINTFRDVMKDTWPFLCISIPVFTISTVMSSIFDKTLTTMMISTVVSAVVGWLILETTTILGSWTPDVSECLPAYLVVLCIPASLYVSHEVFVHGESLKTTRRYLVLARTVFFDIGLVTLSLFAAYLLVYR